MPAQLVSQSLTRLKATHDAEIYGNRAISGPAVVPRRVSSAGLPDRRTMN
jgi:hypothetical protein